MRKLYYLVIALLIGYLDEAVSPVLVDLVKRDILCDGSRRSGRY